VVEDDHWWYRTTRALVGDLLRPWLGTGQRFLDAGCGPGGNGAWLAAHGTVVGIDISPDALAFVRANRADTLPVRGDIQSLPFPSACFHAAVAITVLYTVPDDARALHELARVLRPGGAVVMVEPAFESLRRAHDTTVHGRRRYRTEDLERLARSAGLTPWRSTYAFSFLTPAAWALARASRSSGFGVTESRYARFSDAKTEDMPSDVERRSLDRVFAPLARAERRVLTRHDLSVGTSALLLALKE
jgi:SAM-dependent methyltransferase